VCACIPNCEEWVKCPRKSTAKFNIQADRCFCDLDYNYFRDSEYYENDYEQESGEHALFEEHVGRALRRQTDPMATSTSAAVNTAVLTFIPPPKTDITPELLNQSLTAQPQNTGTVASAIPHLQEGVISFLVQLQGLVADLLTLNASTAFPCGSIGKGSDPDLVLVPKIIKNGTQQIVIADCMLIAVNMYKPTIINYWVQTEDGSVYSIVGDNLVHDLDKVDTTVGSALTILTSLSGGNMKRDVVSAGSPNVVPLERRQVFHVTCGAPCPFYHMQPIKGSDGYCGCMFREPTDGITLIDRGIKAPDAYTATMTEDACKAMSCTQNDNKPAVFNPFSLTCWCVDRPYIEINPSGLSSASS